MQGDNSTRLDGGTLPFLSLPPFPPLKAERGGFQAIFRYAQLQSFFASRNAVTFAAFHHEKPHVVNEWTNNNHSTYLQLVTQRRQMPRWKRKWWWKDRVFTSTERR